MAIASEATLHLAGLLAFAPGNSMVSYKGRVGISTAIYPHYTNHEKIRIRHKKKMLTPVHSIDGFNRKPKEF